MSLDESDSLCGLVFERTIGSTSIKLSPRADEHLNEFYMRFQNICSRVELHEEISGAVVQLKNHFSITALDSWTKSGISVNYQRVIVSLLQNYDQCMGATDVSKEWGGINTGSVSKVFTGSTKANEKYKEHFEECEGKKYRFTEVGVRYALLIGVEEIMKKDATKQETDIS